MNFLRLNGDVMYLNNEKRSVNSEYEPLCPLGCLLGCAAIIPVFNPEPGLIPLCRGLLTYFRIVVVVDDGSVERREEFSRLPRGVSLIHHPENKGKGRAIKTGLSWVSKNHPEIEAVVFADGDGQHGLNDICSVARACLVHKQVVLGVRDFSKNDVPMRSRFGNNVTAFFVRWLYRLPINDTQTGLRAVPARLFSVLMEISGERYEYEMRLFGALHRLGEGVDLLPIRTIYIDQNRASHFNPIKDSFRVYAGLFDGLFLRFCLCSGLAFVVDNALFTFGLFALSGRGLIRRHEILLALFCSRILSATLNYICNRMVVFKSQGQMSRSFAKYAFLVIGVACLSWLMTSLISYSLDLCGALITVAKIAVETILFIVSYFVQKKVVFAKASQKD